LKLAGKFSNAKKRCPICSSPASAAAATQSFVPSILADRQVRMIGVEAGGEGSVAANTLRVSKAADSAFCKERKLSARKRRRSDELTHRSRPGSITLRRPGTFVLTDLGRVEYTYATDDEALNAFKILSETEESFPPSKPRTRSRTSSKNPPR